MCSCWYTVDAWLPPAPVPQTELYFGICLASRISVSLTNYLRWPIRGCIRRSQAFCNFEKRNWHYKTQNTEVFKYHTWASELGWLGLWWLIPRNVDINMLPPLPAVFPGKRRRYAAHQLFAHTARSALRWEMRGSTSWFLPSSSLSSSCRAKSEPCDVRSNSLEAGWWLLW